MNHNVDSSAASRLHKVPVSVSVHVCSQTISLNQLLAWSSGTILTFDQSASAPLELRIGQKSFGTGQAVKLGSKLGLQIRKLG